MKIEPSSGPHSAYEAISERLDSFSAYLTPRYESLEELPGSDGRVGRWVARRISDGAMCLITIVQYGGSILTAEAVEAQQEIGLRMDASTSPRLGELLEWHATPEAHFVVSTLPGPGSLQALLRRRHALPYAQVCGIVRAIAEGVADAAAAGFAPPVIDATTIFLSEPERPVLDEGLQLPLPPLPGPDLLALESRSGVSPHAVQEFAYLACDLLGLPGRDSKFRPAAHLSAATNQLLAGAIDGDNSILDAGPVAFAEAFTGQSIPVRPAAGPDAIAGTAGIPAAPAHLTTTSQAVVKAGSRLQVLATPAIPPANAPVTMPLIESVTAVTRLRLTPRTSGQSMIMLAAGESLTIGRSSEADFVTRFHPRSTRNDTRTRLLSREHILMSLENGHPRACNHAEANMSFCGGQPITGGIILTKSCRLSIAGEYDLDVLRLPSAWDDGDVWGEGCPAAAGGVVLRPSAGMTAWDMRTIWIFTDVPLALGPDGGLRSSPDNDRGALGWLLRGRGQFWLMAADEEGSLIIDGKPLTAREPELVRPDTLLRIGRNEWDVSEAVQ